MAVPSASSWVLIETELPKYPAKAQCAIEHRMDEDTTPFSDMEQEPFASGWGGGAGQLGGGRGSAGSPVSESAYQLLRGKPYVSLPSHNKFAGSVISG